MQVAAVFARSGRIIVCKLERSSRYARGDRRHGETAELERGLQKRIAPVFLPDHISGGYAAITEAYAPRWPAVEAYHRRASVGSQSLGLSVDVEKTYVAAASCKRCPRGDKISVGFAGGGYPRL